jgi:hypothetical protein
VVSSANPAQSGDVGCGDLDSSTRQAVSTTASTPIGTLTRKIPRQLQSVVITPPSTGPSAVETPVMAPQTPNATPRSRPWNVCPISASDVANMIAPPIPCPLRDKISISGFWATPHSSDPRVKMTRPIWNRRLRPYRSASTPEVSSNEARVRA